PGLCHGAGARAVVAAGSGHDDAGVVGVQEGQVDRVEPRVIRPGDRVVEHIDVVGNGLVHCGDGRRARATRGADLVGDHVGVRSDPGHLTLEVGRAQVEGGGVRVASHRAAGVAAVAVLVAGGAAIEGVGTDQLVVALETSLGVAGTQVVPR